MNATRQLLWESGSLTLLYVGSAVAVLMLAGGILWRVLAWRRGRAELPAERIPLRDAAWAMLTNVGLVCDKTHMRMHRGILWGMAILLGGTAWEAANKHFGWGLLAGPPYLAFKLVLDVAGAAVLASIGFVVHERWIHRLPRLESRFRDALPLVLLGLLVLTGFAVEGTRIAATRDPWWFFSPFGSVFALLSLPFSAAQLAEIHVGLWNVHVAIALGLVASLPSSKLFHIIAMPLTIVGARPYSDRWLPRPPSTPSAGTVSGWSRRQLIETDACIRCGRCRSWCSIRHGNLPDSPISMLDGARELFGARKWNEPLVPGAVTADGLWACTTCRTCEDHCAMLGEHVVRVVDLRRAEVQRGSVPPHAAERLAEIESRLTPEAAAPASAPAAGPVLHIWPGCHVAEKDSAILESLCTIVRSVGLTPVVLEPPACCGGPARRLGDEELYLRSANANIAYLRELGMPPMVTPCPHCLVTLGQEYAELGCQVDVIHHAEYLAGLVRAGLLGSSGLSASRVAFHDPCYLARYGGDTSSARVALSGCGVELVEHWKHTARKAFCCGDGGGTALPASAIINSRERLEHFLEAGAETVVTSCPYCKERLEQTAAQDGVPLKFADLSQIVCLPSESALPADHPMR